MLIKQMKEEDKPAKTKKVRQIKPLQTICGVMLLVFFWYIAVGQAILPRNGGGFLSKENVQEIKAYEIPCTQAYVAKIIDLTLAEDKIEEDETALWYEKYYKVLEEDLGITALKIEEALNPITYKQVEDVLKMAFGDKYHISLELDEEALNENISVNAFMQTYKKVLEAVGKSLDVEERDIVILATPADNVGLNAWQLASAGGIYHFEGLILEPLKGKTVRAVVKKNEILNIEGILGEQSVIKTCQIEKVNEKMVTIEVNKLHLTYENKGISLNEEGKCGALVLEGDMAIAFEECIGEQTQAREAVKVTSNTKSNTKSSTTIRVLLSDGGEYNQISVKLKGDGEYKISYNGEASKLKAGTYWKDTDLKWIEGVDVVRFEPVSKESQLAIYTITKASGTPMYKGALEVRKEGDHYILINEVDMEDYVAGVIPSEMPTSYGIEALKVQAIAARTYAYAAMQGEKFTSYGAQIDDTTASQVYNNTSPDEDAYKAALLTEGQILKSEEGQPISSKFFATSCGYTANYGEVWAGESFPSYTPEYLTSEKQYEGKDIVSNMQNEEEAKKFFKLDAKDLEAYDEDSPWFRWKVTLTKKELTDLIKPVIEKISESSQSLVKVKTKTGDWESKTVKDIGTIEGFKVMGRGEGGNILALQVEGENATVKVNTEYLIRSLFASNEKQSLQVTRSDGSLSGNMSLLPSAFFAIDSNDDGSFTLYGGGFGHGVGMSQDGAKGMADMGKDYMEIIEHFYPTVEVAMMGE